MSRRRIFLVLTTQAKGDQPERKFYFNIDLPQQALQKSVEKLFDSAKEPASRR
jgi:hypothetical protein